MCVHLYLCSGLHFADFNEAHDVVNQNVLWEEGAGFYILTKLVSIIRAFHDNFTATVSAYGRISAKLDKCNKNEGYAV